MPAELLLAPVRLLLVAAALTTALGEDGVGAAVAVAGVAAAAALSRTEPVEIEDMAEDVDDEA